MTESPCAASLRPPGTRAKLLLPQGRSCTPSGSAANACWRCGTRSRVSRSRRRSVTAIADRSAVVGDRGLAGPGPTVRHKAAVKAGGGDRDAATTRGRDRRRSRERDGLAAAHGPGALLRNSEEEAWADPRLSDGGARPGLSHRRPGAGMRRAIQDATACREALLRLPKLGLGELRQQWRVLYKAEASAYLSRELLLRAVACRMQEVKGQTM